MTRSRRELTADDARVWRYITRNVNPLNETTSRHPAEDQSSDDPPPRGRQSPPLGSEIPARFVPPSPLVLGSTGDMDRRTAQRFKRGEMSIDGRIDLHGLTLEQAHQALITFIRGAHARGARCVVVVTGKGKGDNIGRIRGEAPHWLNHAPLRSMILAVTEARPGQGGAGALYVLLKRKRG